MKCLAFVMNACMLFCYWNLLLSVGTSFVYNGIILCSEEFEVKHLKKSQSEYR